VEKIDRGRSKKLYKKRKQAWDLTPKDSGVQARVLIACVAVVLLALVIWHLPDMGPKEPVTDITPSLPDGSTSTPVGSTIQEGDAKGAFYFRNTLFVGDSLCVQLSSCDTFARADFAAHQRVNPENVLSTGVFANGTFADTLKKSDPDTVYIALGANGASWMSVDQMITDIGNLVQKIREQNGETTILVLSAPSYAADTAAAYPNYDNEQVAAFNTALKGAALDWGVYYLDSGSGLTASLADGRLSYSEADLQALEKYIATHTVK